MVALARQTGIPAPAIRMVEYRRRFRRVGILVGDFVNQRFPIRSKT